MLAQQLKEHIVEGSVYFICKNKYQNSVFQPLRPLTLKTFSPSPTTEGPIIDIRQTGIHAGHGTYL